MGEQHALPACGLRQVPGAAVGEVQVDDQRAARPRLVERGGLGELLGTTSKRRETTTLLRRGQRDRVVDR
ncbi:MAG TPA: hypothetical protein VGE11_08475 [Pseudonocardia sp.]